MAEDVKRALIGAIVITKYNNRTYRIDDVDFDLSPMSKHFLYFLYLLASDALYYT